MAKQLRRMHGGNTPSTPAPVSGWLGAPIERCPTDAANPLVPRAVTLPASAVEVGLAREIYTADDFLFTCLI